VLPRHDVRAATLGLQVAATEAMQEAILVVNGTDRLFRDSSKQERKLSRPTEALRTLSD